MSEPARAKTRSNVEIRHVITRACIRCSGVREQGKPCAGCGLADPPEVHDLGVAAAQYKNLFRQLWWSVWGVYCAGRRIRKANAAAAAIRNQ